MDISCTFTRCKKSLTCVNFVEDRDAENEFFNDVYRAWKMKNFLESKFNDGLTALANAADALMLRFK